jgi:hypothetical protein
MPLQRFTTGVVVMLCYGFNSLSPSCSGKVSPTKVPVAPCGSQAKNRVIPYSPEQGIHPIASLIRKQAVCWGPNRQRLSGPDTKVGTCEGQGE